jgi:SAM-dependent methyltransferase
MRWISRRASQPPASGQPEPQAQPLRDIVFERCDVAQPTSWGFIDCVEIDSCGIVRVNGWATQSVSIQTVPELSINQVTIPVLHLYRTPRPDVMAHFKLSHVQAGIVFEYLVPNSLRDQVLSRPLFALTEIYTMELDGRITFITPHYGALLHSSEVFHREHIYGFGPPNAAIDPPITSLLEFLEGRILDFGCGSGVVVHQLRSSGLEAWGLELDNAMIRNHILPEARPFITLYDGAFPSPFPDCSFESVFCSEVLEHIPQYEQAIAEIARVATRKAILTVPDMSAVPLGFRHRLIPWHLLEATHVNFFTQSSLERLLRRYFSDVEFGRASPCQMNDTFFYVSLVAFCTV